MHFLEQNEAIIRFGIFAWAMILFGMLEAFFPARERGAKRRTRWRLNVSLAVLDAFCLRLLMPILAVGMAVIAATKNWGIFNQFDLPAWLEVIMCVIFLDLAIYAQHIASHRIPALWRFHAVHHADNEVDVTTGVRFHPIEAILSMGFKIAIVLAVGAPVLSVVLFELILSISALFNHSNMHLPPLLENKISRMVVTPKMHRIHHSAIAKDANNNYGFFLSIWDRLFGTYNSKMRSATNDYPIGLPGSKSTLPTSITETLLLPFRLNRSLNRVSDKQHIAANKS